MFGKKSNVGSSRGFVINATSSVLSKPGYLERDLKSKGSRKGKGDTMKPLKSPESIALSSDGKRTVGTARADQLQYQNPEEMRNSTEKKGWNKKVDKTDKRTVYLEALKKASL